MPAAHERPDDLWPADIQSPASVVLRDLLLRAPDESVTLGWLVDSLGDRSFGIVLLLLGVLASLPGASAIAGVLISVLACQMILARPAPVFPRFLAARSFQKQRLARMQRRAVPALRYIERFVRPRWQTPFRMARRGIGVAVLLIDTLLFAPVPLSNIPPALAIILLAFSHLEEDGLLLCIALLICALLLLIAAGIVWQAMGAAGWVTGPFW